MIFGGGWPDARLHLEVWHKLDVKSAWKALNNAKLLSLGNFEGCEEVVYKILLPSSLIVANKRRAVSVDKI